MGSFLRFLMLKYVNDGDAATALDIALTKIITHLIVNCTPVGSNLQLSGVKFILEVVSGTLLIHTNIFIIL